MKKKIHRGGGIEQRRMSDRDRETERQQDMKEEFVALCSFPLQPQLLYTLSLFMYKCPSPPLRAGPTKSPHSLRLMER